MRVRYTRQAVADLLGIADYIRDHNPSAAIDVETAIRSTIDLLADYPKLGRDRPELDVRALGVPRYPSLPHRARRDLDRRRRLDAMGSSGDDPGVEPQLHR